MTCDVESVKHQVELWFAVLAGPVLALAVQLVNFVVTPWACGSRQLAWLHLAPGVALAASLGAAYWCHGLFVACRDQGTVDAGSIAGRNHFLGLFGAGLGVFSALVIAAMWMITFLLDPCH